MFRNPVDWAEAHFVFDRSSSKQGRFEISEAPFLRDVMEGFANPLIRSGSCMCAAQSGKTQTGIILACWAQDQDPGPFMWVMPAKDEAQFFAQTRLTESFQNCPPVARLMPKGRANNKTLEINFASAPLILVGAQSGSKLSGKPIRWLFLDEEKDYAAGAIEKALKRTRSKKNAKIWRMSTPEKSKGTIHLEFLAGDQRHWHVKCPCCGHDEHLQFKHLKWDKCEAIQDTLASIQYQCPGKDCTHAWRDTPRDRAYLSGEGGKWIAHNLNAPKDCASWTWNALLPKWVKWSELVQEWFKAIAAKKAGNLEPLKVFLNETACEPYEEEFGSDPVTLTSTNYNLEDYANGELIDDEAFRFMTIDKQQSWWWVIIRAWRRNGSSRLLYFNRILTRDGLEALRKQFKVLAPLTFEDASFRDTDVFKDCADLGWTAIRGSREDEKLFHFKVKVPNRPDKTVLRLYSQICTVYGDNRPARMIWLATEKLKDMLHNFRTGQGPQWEIPLSLGDWKVEDPKVAPANWRTITEEYHRQMSGETKREQPDSKGRMTYAWVKTHDNHAWDCEYYSLAAALMQRLMPGDIEVDTSRETAGTASK